MSKMWEHGDRSKINKERKVLGLNMEPTLDPPNSRNITNTMAIEGFYNSLLLSRLHSFPKGFQFIIFIINGRCYVLLKRISFLEKWFYAITSLAERDTVFGVQVEFLEGRYPRFSENFLDSLKTHIEQEKIIHDSSCFRYS